MLRKAIRKTAGLLFLVALLAGALVTGGCAKKPTAEDIVAKMQEVMSGTEDGHAIVEVTATVQSESVHMTIEVWGKRPNKVRVKVLETDRDELVGAVTVTDGQTAWFYRPTESQVIVGDVSHMPDTTPEEIIQDMDGFIQRVLDASDVELLGEEEVAGVETYKLSLTPKEDEEQQLPVTGTATLWVDQSKWIVLKAHLDAPNIGEGTAEVRSFELNPGLEDEVFTFEVSEGTEIVHAEDIRPQHMTLDEAIAQANFALLTPDYLPGGSTLVDVMKVQGAFVLLYDRDGATFTLAQSLEVLPSEWPIAGEPVTVRGVEAKLIVDRVGGTSLLAWQEKEINFTIAGHIGEDEAIKVAESLK